MFIDYLGREREGWLHNAGYVIIMVDKKKALEHVFIYEQYHNIKIEKGYDIHHLDYKTNAFCKQNNVITNLQLLSHSEHLRLHQIGNKINLGKKHSEATKQKWSEQRTGKDNSFYGKHHSEETLQYLSEINSGSNHPRYGSKHTEETKRKMSEAIKKNQQKKKLATMQFYKSIDVPQDIYYKSLMG